MTKIDIFSGFLGAGKTTLIKKLIAEAYSGEKLVLIENEFGEINIDGGFLKESGIEISEMSAGCICCSLVGDFNKALKEVVAQFHPDRILIEPSGVGKLSDVIVAVERTVDECPGELKLNSYVTVADASKVKVYMKNFGEFYNNQIEAAGTIILSRTQKLSQEKLEAAAAMLREKNPDAAILTTPWDELDGKTIQPEEGKFTVTLLADDNRITGVGACNRLMGKYETTEKGALKIGPLASTMMACPGMEQENAFAKALESTTHYDMDGPMLLLLSDGELKAVFQAKP